MSKKEVVWFWTNDLDVCGGEIWDWLTPYQTGRESIAKIRCFNGFSIHLPPKRLYDSEKECIAGLREYKLNIIL
jgi:hypothetical protein